MKSFYQLQTIDDLANTIDIKKSYITYVLYHLKPENSYHIFEIPKKNGSTRTIEAPNRELKYIQRRISDRLYDYIENEQTNNISRNTFSHGFAKNKSIITNAAVHTHKKYIINYDLDNYFPSIHFGRVLGLFNKNKLFNCSYKVALILAQLVCFNGHLPQGAPTSPIISNLICGALDYQVYKLAKKHRLHYTRYADDLTFSTNDYKIVESFENFDLSLKKVIEHEGFSINTDKTRFTYNTDRQQVTGLVVNKKVNIKNEYYKETRAMTNNLFRKGYYYIGDRRFSDNLNPLEGRLSFIRNIERASHLTSIIDPHNTLLFTAKQKEFQKFLLYKYFIINDKPLIITEGKTDILHIRAAIKSLQPKFNSLLQSDQYQVRFFTRFNKAKGDNLQLLFNLSKDNGGSELRKLFSLLIGNKKNNGIYTELIEKYNLVPNAPVIFLLDREGKKSPLNSFLFAVKESLGLSEKPEMDENWLALKHNLYLLTLPKHADEDVEIEDLYDPALLTINGKTLDRHGTLYRMDTTKYSKDFFSKYVTTHYREIDFSGFEILLANICDIMQDFNDSNS